MDDRLQKACTGSSATSGGMNVPELRDLAKARGLPSTGTRKDLIDRLCGAAGSKAASLARPAASPYRPSVATTASVWIAGQLTRVSASQIPRGYTVQGHALDGSAIYAPDMGTASPSPSPSPSPQRPAMKSAKAAPVRPSPSPLAASSGPSPAYSRPAATMTGRPEPKMPALPKGQVGINTKAWGQRKPGKGKGDRQAYLAKCGSKCYLAPEEMSYPVCDQANNCEYDCDGLRAVIGLTSLLDNKKNISDVARKRASDSRLKAIDLGVQHCGWEMK